MRFKTCALVCRSSTTLSTPPRCSMWDRRRPAGPPPMIVTWVRCSMRLRFLPGDDFASTPPYPSSPGKRLAPAGAPPRLGRELRHRAAVEELKLRAVELGDIGNYGTLPGRPQNKKAGIPGSAPRSSRKQPYANRPPGPAPNKNLFFEPGATHRHHGAGAKLNGGNTYTLTFPADAQPMPKGNCSGRRLRFQAAQGRGRPSRVRRMASMARID